MKTHTYHIVPDVIRSPYPDVTVPDVNVSEFVLSECDKYGDAPAFVSIYIFIHILVPS